MHIVAHFEGLGERNNAVWLFFKIYFLIFFLLLKIKKKIIRVQNFQFSKKFKTRHIAAHFEGLGKRNNTASAIFQNIFLTFKELFLSL